MRELQTGQGVTRKRGMNPARMEAGRQGQGPLGPSRTVSRGSYPESAEKQNDQICVLGRWLTAL